MSENKSPFLVTYEHGHGGLGYIYVAGPIDSGGVERSVVVERYENIILDFDAEGRLLGIEILDGRLMHPSTKAVAVPPGKDWDGEPE